MGYLHLSRSGMLANWGCRGCPQHLLHLQECPSLCHHHQTQSQGQQFNNRTKSTFVFGKANKKLHCNRCNHCNQCEALKQVALYQRQVAPGGTSHGAKGAALQCIGLQNIKEESENRGCLSENRGCSSENRERKGKNKLLWPRRERISQGQLDSLGKL